MKFYETPASFVRELLRRESFHENVWEPAAGEGGISTVLREHGHNVFETDAYPAQDHILEQNFLDKTKMITGHDIITNPPFRLNMQIAQRAFAQCYQKFALVAPIKALGGVERYREIYSAMPVSKVIIAPGVQHARILGTQELKACGTPHMWVVVDKGHVGDTKLIWSSGKAHRGKIPEYYGA
jgi:hypothetical protein